MIFLLYPPHPEQRQRLGILSKCLCNQKFPQLSPPLGTKHLQVQSDPLCLVSWENHSLIQLKMSVLRPMPATVEGEVKTLDFSLGSP